MTKFKVSKVTPDKKQTLVFQLVVGEVRPGTDPLTPAVNYVISHVPHKVFDIGTSPLMDSDGVHLTRWIVLDDTDIYWLLPGGRFKKKPAPVVIK